MFRASLALALLLCSALAARPASAQQLEIDLGAIAAVSEVSATGVDRADHREILRLQAEILEIDTTPHVVATLLGLGGLLGGAGLAMGGLFAPCDETNVGLLPGCDGPAALVAGGAILSLTGLVTLIVGIASWNDASVRRNELRRSLERVSAIRLDGSSLVVSF